jgi:hypothetical protein
MEEVVEVLLHKLSDKGLTPVEVPRLVKDVLSIVGKGGEFTTHSINLRLESPWARIRKSLTRSLFNSLLQFWSMRGITKLSEPRYINP